MHCSLLKYDIYYHVVLLFLLDFISHVYISYAHDQMSLGMITSPWCKSKINKASLIRKKATIKIEDGNGNGTIYYISIVVGLLSFFVKIQITPNFLKPNLTV